MSNDFNSNSRSGYRAKRKKTNIVLNSLIVIVLLLIIFVAYNIFASGSDDKAAPKKQEPKTEQKETTQKETATKEKKAKVDKKVDKDDRSTDNAKEDDQESEEASTPEKADESQAVVSDGGSSSNVLKTIQNPSWKPVGTTQSGEHTPTYSGVDWDEMLNAISYATGLDQSNMKVYWLGSDKSTSNASTGTVYSNDKQQKYRVFIKWVDGEGWIPTKVEELAELEK
ncbi:YrrS family protein [Neobacillus sp. WH10]|uniref:YrrS family protein n=1 Tax=Neobacillus sp. WH10 TaxID=3047873 RepID=UPI0024C17F03|nr:YrrS family protein [Neobacillus sp. WH10]WHY76279.1 YrrS family protein [Neobacillus sp. WH10]